MSGSDFSVQHWQQRALLAERRLAELQQLSPRPRAFAHESPPKIPLEVLSAINSNFGSSIQAHDVSGAADVLRGIHDDFLQLRREHQTLRSMIARDASSGEANAHLLQQEVENCVQIIDDQRHECEVLRRRKEEVDVLLQNCQQQCQALRSTVNQLQQDRETLNLIRSFEIQLMERDERLASMASELESCYSRLGENESEHVRRHEEDRLSIILKDDLIKSFQEQMRIRDEELVSITAELDSCYARLEDSDSLLESACSSLQNNIRLGQEAALKVAQQDAGVLESAGQYFLKHLVRAPGAGLLADGSSHHTTSRLSSPGTPNSAFASGASVNGVQDASVILSLNKSAV